MSAARLDTELVSRGLVSTRTKANRLISEGLVRVAGNICTKPSRPVHSDELVELLARDLDVSRGAKKLRAALALWPLPVQSAYCVDLGASTGGFTQVLLEHGARSVTAVDVGHHQLAPSVSEDPRVVSLEGVNVTSLTAQWWQARALPEPSIVVADLSFISLTKVIPPVVELFGVHSHYLVLVKPQFEVGRGGLVGGIVKDVRRRSKALDDVARAFVTAGVPPRAVMVSPITGEKGNLEYLLYASAQGAPHPTEWDGSIATVVN